jgi:hypothetical protein
VQFTTETNAGNNTTMKIASTSTLATVLRELYGPNGNNVSVHEREARRIAVMRELERHGLVTLTPLQTVPGKTFQSEMGWFNVRRTLFSA